MKASAAEAAFFVAHEARVKAQRALEGKRFRLMQAAENKIDVDLWKSAERGAWVALKTAEHHAQAAWDEAKVADAVLKKHEKGGVGTKLIEWGSGSGYYRRELRVTGRVGRIAIWTADSAHPANMRWGLPSVGDFYVRIQRKDGSFAKTFCTLNNYGSLWLPEGKVPDGK